MIAVFPNQHVGQKARTGAPPLDRARWQRGLRERLTAGAGHARTYNPAGYKATGNIIQFLGNILADLAQGASTIATLITGRQHIILPVQMIG